MGMKRFFRRFRKSKTQMKLREMLNGLEMEAYTKTVTEEQIPQVEKWLGVKLGPQLREFILEYSLLRGKGMSCDIEGITAELGENDVMVKETRRMRELCDGLENFVFIENEAIEDVDTIVDTEDNVFWLDYSEEAIIDAEMKLFDYIYLRVKYGDWIFMTDEARAKVEMSEEDRLRYADA